jgi:uncharacterized protein with ATP-grasp and redox domains
MRIHPECIPCIFDRAKFECDLAFGNDEEGKLEALLEISRYASEKIDWSTVPALIGTERGRIISRVSGVADPYAELKRESNRAGSKVLPIAVSFYEKSSDKLRALLTIAAAANSMEYGVRGHQFDEGKFKGEFEEILMERVYGDLKAVRETVKKFSKILYLLDNAGEVVIDKFVVERLEEMGKVVLVSPKSRPVINDVTSDELIGLGFDAKKIIPSGSFVGVSLEEAPKDFLDVLFDPEYLVIAKGMGNYETLSEFQEQLKGRLVYVLRAKCLSVADSVNVKKGTLVITSV